MNGVRWSLVTFTLGITCGVLGHYLPTEAATYMVFVISFLFAMFGGMVVQDGGNK